MNAVYGLGRTNYGGLQNVRPPVINRPSSKQSGIRVRDRREHFKVVGLKNLAKTNKQIRGHCSRSAAYQVVKFIDCQNSKDCHGRKQNKSILVTSTLAGLESSIVIGLFFHFCFQFQQSSFHWFKLSNRVVNAGNTKHCLRLHWFDGH